MTLRLIPALHKATHEVGLFLDRQRASLPVSQAESHVLSWLVDQGGSGGLADLHRSFGHKRSTLTGIVDRLEERGLIERRAHPEDRRAFLLALTPAGRKLGSAARRALAGLERGALSLGEPKLAACLAVLEALITGARGAGPGRPAGSRSPGRRRPSGRRSGP